MATKGFLVGINDYLPVGTGGPDLNGCINDVRDMANTLVILGYSPRTLKLCTDARATRINILNGLKWLLKDAVRGDSLVFYYSGHGSQITDIHRNEEPDFMDEILCPHDIDFANNVVVSDDDISAILSTLQPGVFLDVILDSCHSGTATKAIHIGVTGDTYTKSRYLAPPIDFTFHSQYNPNMNVRNLIRTNGHGTKEIAIDKKLNHVVWTACRSDQTCEETMIEGQVRGVFTYQMCQVLKRTNGNITRQRLNSLVSAAIARSGFTQVPQLEITNKQLLDKPFCSISVHKQTVVVEEEVV
ncbi:MAG: caspase family protein [Bacteroidota bacterium]